MQVQLLLHDACTMEDTIGPIGNPKLLEKHAKYGTHGPIGLCAQLQGLYSGLLKADSWPALADSIPPESNNATVTARNPNAFSEQSSPHANEPKEFTSIPQDNDSHSLSGDKVSHIALSPKIWKYIAPADPDQIIKVNGKEYFWCVKCYDNYTGKVGIYNLTHKTSQHKRGVRHNRSRNRNDQQNDAPNYEDHHANLSSVRSIEGEVKKSTDKSSTNQEKKVAFDDVDVTPEDEDEFQFQGAFLHSAEDEAWVTSIDDNDENIEFLNQPLPLPELRTLQIDATTEEKDNDQPHENLAFDTVADAIGNLAMSTIANEMQSKGFSIETINTAGINQDVEVPPPEIDTPAVLGPELPPHDTEPDPNSHPFGLNNLPNVTQEQLKQIPGQPFNPQIAFAMVALAEAAEPRSVFWPSNVVSALPGMTLYDINGAPHLIFKDIHTPAHCSYCGRLGDWLTSCCYGKDLHNMSDDDDYSAGQLAIHWDSDVDTTEFLETNEDTDEEEQGDEDKGVASVNNLNTTTTHYSQSSFNLCCPLLFWWLIYISFHSLTSVFNWLKTIFELILAWSWNKTSVLVMTLTALLWDTTYYYLDPKAPTTPYLSRSIKRKLKRTNLVPFRSYHRSWMLLSSFMLFF